MLKSFYNHNKLLNSFKWLFQSSVMELLLSDHDVRIGSLVSFTVNSATSMLVTDIGDEMC